MTYHSDYNMSDLNVRMLFLVLFFFLIMGKLSTSALENVCYFSNVITDNGHVKEWRHENENAFVECHKLLLGGVNTNDISGKKWTHCRKERRVLEAREPSSVIASITPAFSNATGCASKWNLHGNSCYLVQEDHMQWEAAKIACGTYHSDSHLVTFDDQVEFEYVRTNLLFKSHKFWIGYNIQNGTVTAIDGKVVWNKILFGSTVSTTRCYIMTETTSDVLSDPCNYAYPFVCKID